MGLKKQSGLGLVEVVIGIGMLGMFWVIFSGFLVYTKRQQMHQTTLFNIEQTRRNLSVLISNRNHWKTILEQNSNLECLLDSSVSCPHNSPMNFVIYTEGPVQFLDPATQGFTRDGTVCALGDPNCIMKLDIAVTTLCAPTGTPPAPPANCENPVEVLVEGRFEFDSGTSESPFLAFNPENYLVRVRKEDIMASQSGQIVKLKCSWWQSGGVAHGTCTHSGGSQYHPPCPAGFQSIGEYSYLPFDGFVRHLVSICERL